MRNLKRNPHGAIASTPRMNVFVAEVDFEAGTMQASRLVSLRHDGKNRGVRWSADGSRLAYLSDRSASSPGGALVFQDFNTGQERDVEVSVLNFFSKPFWSPDLTKLVGPAKVPGHDNDARALYLVNAQTGQRSMILDKDAACANYTRDGRYLVYLCYNWKESDSVHQLIERELESEVGIRHRECGFAVRSSIGTAVWRILFMILFESP